MAQNQKQLALTPYSSDVRNLASYTFLFSLLGYQMENYQALMGGHLYAKFNNPNSKEEKPIGMLTGDNLRDENRRMFSGFFEECSKRTILPGKKEFYKNLSEKLSNIVKYPDLEGICYEAYGDLRHFTTGFVVRAKIEKGIKAFSVCQDNVSKNAEEEIFKCFSSAKRSFESKNFGNRIDSSTVFSDYINPIRNTFNGNGVQRNVNIINDVANDWSTQIKEGFLLKQEEDAKNIATEALNACSAIFAGDVVKSILKEMTSDGELVVFYRDKVVPYNELIKRHKISSPFTPTVGGVRESETCCLYYKRSLDRFSKQLDKICPPEMGKLNNNIGITH